MDNTITKKNCLICNEIHLENEFLKLGKCGHNICSACLVHHITNNLAERVRCPLPSCEAIIFDPIIRKCLSNDQLLIYECPLSQGAKKCPITECPFLYIPGESFGVFECEFCLSPICIACNDIHYPGPCCVNDRRKASFLKKAADIIKKKKREASQLVGPNNIFENPDAFTCCVCNNFILPRAGAILRNCLHSLCRDCLRDIYVDASYMRNFKCQYCGKELDLADISAIVPEERIVSMMFNEGSGLFYNCKTVDCVGRWEAEDGTNSHECPICSVINCMRCCDIHPGVSCEQFQSQAPHGTEMMAYQEGSMTACYNCKRDCCRVEGRSVVCCVGCGNYTCIFKGLLAGSHDISMCGCENILVCDIRNKYCGCTADQRCDVMCLNGCTPE